MGGYGGIRGGKKKGGIKISMHGGVGERGGLYNTEKTVVILQYFSMLMDSDCKVVYRGDLV